MRTDISPSEILCRLHSGRLSRNGAFDLFTHPVVRRAHLAYKRLLALKRELQIPGTSVRVTRFSDSLEIYLEVERMSYRHQMRLTDWETGFFLTALGGEELLQTDLNG